MRFNAEAISVALAFSAIASSPRPAAAAVDHPPRRQQNLFSDGAAAPHVHPDDDELIIDPDDPNDDGSKHVGCKAFLKEDHTPQDLPAVNYDPAANGSAVAASSKAAAVACSAGEAAGYPCLNIDLMSLLPLSAFPEVSGNGGNDIWGWTDSVSKREFAIMCLKGGVAFVEVTDPVNPVYVGYLPTHTSNSSWRDVKTYANHAFVVSEASGHGMQVFDLTQLLTATNLPVAFSNTAHYSGFGNAHNIVINEGSGYAYGVGTGTFRGGLHFVDITTPESPVAAGGYSSDRYTHDAQCINYDGPDTAYLGREICFNYNEDTLTIVDVTNKASPAQISRTTYAGDQYTHQGWLTEDRNYVLFNDEIDESRSGHNTRTHVFDVSDLDAPVYRSYHDGTTSAIDHNLYIKGDLVFEANYRAGLQVLKMGNLANAEMTMVGYFDVYTTSNSANYNGAWSNYPYFDSGTVIVSGIEQGLFVLRSPNNFGLTTEGPTAAPTALDGFCTDGSRSCDSSNPGGPNGVSLCDCGGGGRRLRGEGHDHAGFLREASEPAPSLRARRVQTCTGCIPSLKRNQCPSCCVWASGNCNPPSTPPPTGVPTTPGPTAIPTPKPTGAPVTGSPTKTCGCSATALPTSSPTKSPTKAPQTNPPTNQPVEACLGRNAVCTSGTCCAQFTCQASGRTVKCK